MDIVLANLFPQEDYMSSEHMDSRITTLHFPMGLGIIAAVLKNAGWPFSTYDSYVNGTTEGFMKMIQQKCPDAVLLSGFLGNYSYKFVKDISLKIKSLNKNTIIIIGGPMASSIPYLLISKTSIDFVVKGEGECTIIELLEAIDINKSPAKVKGIYYKDTPNRVFFTGERERINNLDDSTFPFYSIFPVNAYVNYLNETDRCWEISTSRGCYARCNFCKLTFGQKITSHSYQYIVDHMIYVSERYGVNKFSFVDDNFLNNPNHIDNFVTILKDLPQKFKWRFQGRADKLSPAMVEEMVNVGLYDISFGIESGSQKMLNHYGKNLDIMKTFSTLDTIKSMVRIHATFIVGGPKENWDTIEETKLFIRRLKLNNAGFGILTLFPGTIFYDEAKKNGLINDDDEYCMNLGPVYDRSYVNISDMSDDDLIEARDMLVETAAEFGSYM
ncbi:MAG: B12-binding domain-containing radical SAM protein [Candidatus Scalindua sp.]|jgi:anaerobic magnesium-protoporphyrin IX monomethyl ester cyclase|nr:B12-binding domain-containing radical SAM protein [Candidatus Scalindua sp.]